MTTFPPSRGRRRITEASAQSKRELRRARPERLPHLIYYRDDMVAPLRRLDPLLPGVARLARPERLLREALSRRLTLTLCGDFYPVTVEQLQAAHDPAYVQSILEGRRANALGLPADVYWEAARWQLGAFVAAAKAAANHPGSTVCAPVTDFAQAGYRWGRQGCTFNAYLVAAIALKNAGVVRSVGLLDMDWRVGQVRIPLMADSDSIAIADSVPDDGGHLARVS